MQEFSLDQPTNPSQLVGLLEKANVPKVQFEKDMVIFREGSKGDQAFFIAAGGVKILKKSDSGADKLLDILKSGVIFGEMALLDEPTRSATAVADSIVRIYAIDRKMMAQLTQTVPEFSIWLLQTFSQRLRTLNQKVAQMEKLQEMNTKMIMMQQKERVRIARDLNEGPVQQFSDYLMTLEVLELAAKKKPESLPAELSEFREKLKKGLAKLNNLATVLSPSDVEEVGFSEVLYYLASNMEREEVYKVNFKSDRVKAEDLDSGQQNTLYLIAQDALRNLAELGNVTTVTISLQKLPNRITLIIADDGPGYDFNKVKQGFFRREVETFQLMRDRAMLVGGNMTIQTAEGQGTRLQIEVPLKPPQ